MDIDDVGRATHRQTHRRGARLHARWASRYFHEAHDRRAIFLRLYYMMTLEVHAAINGCGDYEDRDVFMDPGWVRRLSGKFSTLYFKSLMAPAADRAWRSPTRPRQRPGSSVVENALLGINAHINFDLPRAIAKNLEGDDLGDFMTSCRSASSTTTR